MKVSLARSDKARGKQQSALMMVLAALALIAAVWSWLAFGAPGRSQTLDQHVKSIASQLRGPVCQGESVADSPAPLAQQMRLVIRTQLQAGRSDQEIIQYFASRYGEQNIVWSPPWQGFTLLTWLVPILLLSAGVILLLFIFRDWLAASRLAQQNDAASKSVLAAATSRDGEGPADDPALAQYRLQLERELASDDPLFEHYTREAN